MRYGVCLAAIVAFGAVLRIHQVAHQIVGDDEWHAVSVSVHHSFGYIATHFHSADNCIPLTLFYKLLIESVGLSEWSLRGLQLGLGTIGVAALPLLVRPRLGAGASLVFGGWLAISPMLVYYSRYARPYGLVIVLSFVALWSYARWIESGRRRDAGSYVGAAVLSGWLSPVSLPGLLAPPVASLALGLWNSFRTDGTRPEADEALRSPREIATVLAIAAAGIAAWLLPALASLGAIKKKVGAGSFEASTLSDFGELFSGTSYGFLALDFAVLAAIGFVVLSKTAPILFRVVAVAILAQYLALVVVSPSRVFIGVVLARYSIMCLPLFILAASTGLWAIAKHLGARTVTGVSVAIVTAAFAVFFWLGPLPRILFQTNSFVGHDAFQYDYDHAHVGIPRGAMASIPGFYRELGESDDSHLIVEYPQVIWWSGTFYHRYQDLHRQRVLAGHPAFTYALPFGVLPLPRRPGLALSNFVDVESPAALRGSGAHFLVIHKDPANEYLFLSHLDSGRPAEDFRAPARRENIFDIRYGPKTRQLAEKTIAAYRRTGVEPHYTDRWIAVFDLRSLGVGTR